jgi:hypothetical protein
MRFLLRGFASIDLICGPARKPIREPVLKRRQNKCRYCSKRSLECHDAISVSHYPLICVPSRSSESPEIINVQQLLVGLSRSGNKLRGGLHPDSATPAPTAQPVPTGPATSKSARPLPSPRPCPQAGASCSGKRPSVPALRRQHK